MKPIAFLAPFFAGCLSACATLTGADLIKLGEGPGAYNPPVTQAEWARFNILDPDTGKADPLVDFYLRRDLKVDGGKVVYTALYDHRKAEAELRKLYETSAQFDARFPQFVQHKGMVDCGTFKNQAVIDRLHNLHETPFKTEQSTRLTEAAKLVCVLFKNQK